MADTLEQTIARERENLTEKRKEILAKQKELDKQLAELDREFTAVAAYEAAKKGRSITIGGAATGSRAPRGQRQQQIIDILRKNPSGVGRADILEALGVKGDKSGEQSVSNALNNMKKAGKVKAADGKYLSA